MKQLKMQLLTLFLIACFLFTGCSVEIANPASSDASLSIHYISVGQGNAVLAESDGEFMLIDGGERSHSAKVISYLKEQNVETLDYVITTHYDSDHLSGVVGAIQNFSVGTLLDPDYETDSKLFSSYVKTKKSLGITSVHPTPGEIYRFGACDFTILAPNSDYYSDENEYSIAIRLTCGSTSFLLTGDASRDSEVEMLASGLSLESDVFLAGHHGSSTSNSEEFVKAVNPSYAVISVGRDNSYGHPHRETMALFSKMDIPVYRTDTQGTIIVESDGSELTFNTQPDTQFEEHEASTQDTSLPFIANKNTCKFHTSDCSGLPKEKNRIYFKTAKEALKEGYEPCKTCKPTH